MISGFSNERVSYNVRYLNFPSTMTEGISSTKAPTLHVIKIRFNNVFKNEKVLFGFIAVSLSLLSLIAGYTLYSVYKSMSAPAVYESTTTELGMDENVLNQTAMIPGIGSASGNGTSSSYNGGGGNGYTPGTATLAQNNDSKTNKKTVLSGKKVIVTVDDKLSVNPFLPSNEVKIQQKTAVNPYYILPPDNTNQNSDAANVVKTTISGILFDKYSPSAIINIGGEDYLVKKGDVINNYRVLGISSEKVTVQLGENVYTVGVGETIAQRPMQQNLVPNINKRFGGSNGIDGIVIKSKKQTR